MSAALDFYRGNYLHRYDQDGIIPYLSASDFPGLQCRKDSFLNASGVRIATFFFHYGDENGKPLLLFLPGMGPGHIAYIREIELFCNAGYTVMTLDYAGCGFSEGEILRSFNCPTGDTADFLRHYALNTSSLSVVGHSMGGYTAYNIMTLFPEIPQAIILSGFYSMEAELKELGDLEDLFEYEKETTSPYDAIDNLSHLKETVQSYLIIHSNDDQLVPFEHSSGALQTLLHNDHIQFLTVQNKRHNPNYDIKAVQYMNDSFTEYTKKVYSKELKTFEEKKQFMQSRSAMRMTDPDPFVRDVMLSFLKKNTK